MCYMYRNIIIAFQKCGQVYFYKCFYFHNLLLYALYIIKKAYIKMIYALIINYLDILEKYIICIYVT